jgi:transcriptional regulator with XRE-family HTH domain
MAESIGERIQRLRTAEGWSLTELGERMGKAINRRNPDGSPRPFSGEALRLYEADENEPGKDALKALALVFQKSEPYIQFGMSGNRGYLSDEALEFARMYDGLDRRWREYLREQVHVLLAANKAGYRPHELRRVKRKR